MQRVFFGFIIYIGDFTQFRIDCHARREARYQVFSRTCLGYLEERASPYGVLICFDRFISHFLSNCFTDKKEGIPV